MVASLNLRPTYTLLPSHISWPWKPRVCILAPGAQHGLNYVSTIDQSPVTPFHESTPLYLIWLKHVTF